MSASIRSTASADAGKVSRAALVALWAFTLIAVAGYAVFGLHPEWIPPEPYALRIYGVAFPWFARAQIVVAALALFVALSRHAGFRWLVPLVLVYGVSFTAEHVGTGTGFPFSGYGYTGLLGPKLLGRVPWLIPVSWFLMAAPSWIMARAAFPGARRAPARIGLAAALLVTWDLALDPAMSHLTSYWVWERPGSFYGMPWINLLGWGGTGLVIMAVLELLARKLDWAGTLPARWAAWYYGAVLLMPLGMVTAAGLWGAVAATAGALLLLAGIARTARPAERERADFGGGPLAGRGVGGRV